MKLLRLFACMLTLCGFLTTSIAAAADKPNILYIMSDDHAAHAIGAYGGRLAQLDPTPTIDRLATEGTRFTNVFCGNSICVPSRATILTGQHSHINGVLTLRESLAPQKQVLPKLMSAAGYETAMIGKWHLKQEPAAFDYYAVLPGQGKYHNPTLRMQSKGKFPNNSQQFDGHSSDVITDLSLAWLKQRKSDKPFFLMHHFKAPHGKWEPAHRYDKLYADIDLPEPKSLHERGNHGPLGRPQLGSALGRRKVANNVAGKVGIGAEPQLSDRQYLELAYQTYVKRYLRCVRGIDDNIARLLAYLKKTDQLDNTIILYTSDQGMFLGEHDLYDKRWIYEESLRMPMIIRYPASVPAGATNDDMISNIDFAPTLLDMAGASANPAMQGGSFWPMAQGKPAPADWPTAIYYHYHMNMAHSAPAHYGLRTAGRKLFFAYGKSDAGPPYWEFYDLEKDPHEMNNLIAEADRAKEIAQLKKELVQLRKQFNDRVGPAK